MECRSNVSYDLFLRCLTEAPDFCNETELYYLDEDENEVYCILGYLPSVIPTKPYWVGYGCDMEGGTEFASARELMETEVYCGKSLADRWDSVWVSTIGMISVEAWMENCPFRDEISEENGYWHL